MKFTRRSRPRRDRENPLAYLGLGFVAFALVWTLLTIGAPQTGHASINGTVTHVRDGDTIEIGAVVIRIAALDCPELGSPEGSRALTKMRRLVAGKQLGCTDLGPDRYGRTLGQCTVADDPLTLSEHMVNGGYCTYWGIGR